jgi:hypothetical protein
VSYPSERFFQLKRSSLELFCVLERAHLTLMDRKGHSLVEVGCFIHPLTCLLVVHQRLGFNGNLPNEAQARNRVARGHLDVHDPYVPDAPEQPAADSESTNLILRPGTQSNLTR